MEAYSITDCLNFFDNLILLNTEKYVGIGNLEDIRKYVIKVYEGKYIEETVSVLGVLSQINLIIDKIHSDKNSDIKQLYRNLRKRILIWLKESNTNQEVDIIE